MPAPGPGVLPFQSTTTMVVEFSPTGIVIRPHGPFWSKHDQFCQPGEKRTFTSLNDFVAWFRNYFQYKT